ncbi:MAG: hypothetical protein KDA90_11165 [Planctomycetaceae bacterium]|nr:hypothetical protein [Planctomycetaceae bacterium]
MHLRTLADTAAILAWHGTPPRPTLADQVDAALRLVVVNSRLLYDAWAPLLFRSRIDDPSRTHSHLAEEILTCELLMSSIVGYLQSAGPGLQRQRQLAEHVLQTNRDYSERAVQQVTASAKVLSESLRIERLQRRLLKWSNRLIQPPCASQHGLDALLKSATNDLPRARQLRNWTTMAMSLAVPNRVCTDPLRSGLLQEICGGAISLLPASAYQVHGTLKPLEQRLAERRDDAFMPTAECVSRRW